MHACTRTAPSKSMDQFCPCHQWVSWLVYSPILEEQILEQWSQGQVPRLLNGCASCLQTARLCCRTTTVSSSNCVTASLHRDLHAEQSCESLPRVDEFIPHFFIFPLTVSLYLLTGPHCGWLPTVVRGSALPATQSSMTRTIDPLTSRAESMCVCDM